MYRYFYHPYQANSQACKVAQSFGLAWKLKRSSSMLLLSEAIRRAVSFLDISTPAWLGRLQLLLLLRLQPPPISRRVSSSLMTLFATLHAAITSLLPFQEFHRVRFQVNLYGYLFCPVAYDCYYPVITTLRWYRCVYQVQEHRAIVSWTLITVTSPPTSPLSGYEEEEEEEEDG